jgi:hypothetical protein
MYLRECWMVVDYLRHYYTAIAMEWLTKTTEPLMSRVETRTGDLDDYETNPVNPRVPGGPSGHRALTGYSKNKYSLPTSGLELQALWQYLRSPGNNCEGGGGGTGLKCLHQNLFIGTENRDLITVGWDLCRYVSAEEINEKWTDSCAS